MVLRLIFALVPLIFLAGALIFAYKFPLTPELHDRLRRILDRRRAGKPESEESRSEAEELTRVPIG